MLKGNEGNLSKLMAKFYQLMFSVRGGELTAKLKWENDLEEKITWEDRRMNREGRKCSRNVVIRENSFKLKQKWYLTPARLRIFPISSGKC